MPSPAGDEHVFHPFIIAAQSAMALVEHILFHILFTFFPDLLSWRYLLANNLGSHHLRFGHNPIAVPEVTLGDKRPDDFLTAGLWYRNESLKSLKGPRRVKRGARGMIGTHKGWQKRFIPLMSGTF